MLYITDEIILGNDYEVNLFIEKYKQNNEEGENSPILQCFIDFIYDVWELDSRLMNVFHKRISPDVYPFIKIEFEDEALFGEIDVRLYNASGKKLKKSDELIFEQFKDLYLKSLIPLYDRMENIFEE